MAHIGTLCERKCLGVLLKRGTLQDLCNARSGVVLSFLMGYRVDIVPLSLAPSREAGKNDPPEQLDTAHKRQNFIIVEQERTWCSVVWHIGHCIK